MQIIKSLAMQWNRFEIRWQRTNTKLLLLLKMFLTLCYDLFAFIKIWSATNTTEHTHTQLPHQTVWCGFRFLKLSHQPITAMSQRVYVSSVNNSSPDRILYVYVFHIFIGIIWDAHWTLKLQVVLLTCFYSRSNHFRQFLHKLFVLSWFTEWT